jgi:S1-C subfamily serine protease
VPVVERDVSVDQGAAQEMVRRSGQMGVPVITAGSEVVVGFDRPRLEQIAARYAHASAAPSSGPKLGLAIRSSVGGGVEIGKVRPGSPGAQAGFQVGDVLESLGGQPVNSSDDIERLTRAMQPGQMIDAVVRRDGRRLHLTLTI